MNLYTDRLIKKIRNKESHGHPASLADQTDLMLEGCFYDFDEMDESDGIQAIIDAENADRLLAAKFAELGCSKWHCFGDFRPSKINKRTCETCFDLKECISTESNNI